MINEPDQAELDMVAEFKLAYTGRLSVSGLLPCPFCGSIELAMITVPEKNQIPPLYWLQCNHCGSTGPNKETIDQVRLAWDVRAEIA